MRGQSLRGIEQYDMNLLAALGVLLVQRPAKLPAELDGRFGISAPIIEEKKRLLEVYL